MSGSDDTEITIGTGKMLALFFGLVVLCAVFFGMGFKMGKSYATPLPSAGEATPMTTSSGGERPSAEKASGDTSSNPSPGTALSKPTAPSTSGNGAGSATSAATPVSTTPVSSGQSPSVDPSLAPPPDGYYVQVAAVTKQEDGEALVDALKKKQYPAFSALGPDKLYHVQVGPFADIKNAEDMRAKLVNDGYNPILKR
jgi:DedD protein